MFCQTHDEAIDFLSSAFPDIDLEIISTMYDINSQSVDETMEALVAMENPSMKSQPATSSSSVPAGHALPVVQGTVISPPPSLPSPRGYVVSLPDDFLRVPGWKARHTADVTSQDFMQLLADPIFLRELQREFGPDYESILREHIRAEMQRRASQVIDTRPEPHDHLPQQLEQPVLDPVSMPYQEEYDSDYYGVQRQEEEQSVGDKFQNIIQSFIAKLPTRKKDNNGNGENTSLLRCEDDDDDGVELENYSQWSKDKERCQQTE